MNIVFVTLYDQTCPGARLLAAKMLEAGHDVAMLHFKRQSMKRIAREDEPYCAELKQNYLSTYHILPDGNYYLPFPTFVTDREKDLFVEWIERRGADIVGFSLLTGFSSLGHDLSRRLKARLPKVKIVWGGVHAWFRPEEVLQSADAACVGEGEDALREYAADPNRTDIANLWFHANGQIVRNQVRPLIQDLDAQPFALYGHNEFLLEDDRVAELKVEETPEFFRDVYYIATQRGCPFQCSYCTHSQMRKLYCGQKYLRRRSREHVFRELEQQIPRLQLDGIRFLDDVFLVDRNWVVPFCEEYASRIGHAFGCYAYPVGGLDDMLAAAKKAGLAYINLGIQSGSPYILREIYNRRYSLEDMAAVARKVAVLGVDLVYDVLCMNPYENEGHMRETLEYLLTLPKAVEMPTFRLTFFAGIRITDLDNPRYDLPESLRLFYALLYQSTRVPGLTPAMVREMADNPAYRADPEQMARMLSVMVDGAMQLRAEKARARFLEMENGRLLNEIGLKAFVRRRLRRLFP